MNTKIEIKKYSNDDIDEIMKIWNQVVNEGNAFPQENLLTRETAEEFFGKQDFVGVACYNGKAEGMYILHPNNVGRCSHQCNASYAVSSGARGKGIGEAMVKHSLKTTSLLGYRLLIFNAVVKDNIPAIKLYEKLGFVKIGEIPGGFRADEEYRDTIMFYHQL